MKSPRSPAAKVASRSALETMLLAPFRAIAVKLRVDSGSQHRHDSEAPKDGRPAVATIVASFITSSLTRAKPGPTIGSMAIPCSTHTRGRSPAILVDTLEPESAAAKVPSSRCFLGAVCSGKVSSRRLCATERFRPSDSATSAAVPKSPAVPMRLPQRPIDCHRPPRQRHLCMRGCEEGLEIRLAPSAPTPWFHAAWTGIMPPGPRYMLSSKSIR